MIQKILSNRKYKVVGLCIALATTFWFFNAMNKSNYNTTIDYPINVIFDEINYIKIDEVPTEVEVNVEGTGWKILAASVGLGTDEYNLNVNKYKGRFYILGRDLRHYISTHIDHLKVNFVINDTVFFNVEPRLTKMIQVELDPAFTTSNFTLKYIPKITPSTIEVYGGKSAMENLDSIIYIKVAELSQGQSLRNKIVGFTSLLPELVYSEQATVDLTAVVDEYVDREFKSNVVVDTTGEKPQVFIVQGVLQVLKSHEGLSTKELVEFSLVPWDKDSSDIKCLFDHERVRNVTYAPKRVKIEDSLNKSRQKRGLRNRT